MDLYMSIANMSTGMSQAKLMENVQTQVAAMSISMINQTGDDIAKLLESSVNPSVGSTIDISI